MNFIQDKKKKRERNKVVKAIDWIIDPPAEEDLYRNKIWIESQTQVNVGRLGVFIKTCSVILTKTAANYHKCSFSNISACYFIYL